MIIYENTKFGFINDTFNGLIDEKIDSLIFEKLGHHTGESEIRSWQNSLHRMSEILDDPAIPDDAGIAVEYNVPYTPKRVDMIISGRTEDYHNSAVVIELKQWESVEKVDGMDAIVRTLLGGGMRSVTHPSYQVWSYVQMISDYNASVQDECISLNPCTFLHNYNVRDMNDPLLDPIYSEYIEMAPVFAKKDAAKLREFIKRYVKYGDNRETIYKIDNGRLHPSKSLQDSLLSMLKGNNEFKMIDDQKVIYETIMNLSKSIHSDKNTGYLDKKQTVIVRGGPGTGKSVLAINLLVKMTSDGLVATYVTKNSAPRAAYAVKLKGDFRKNRIDNLFKGSGSFTESENGIFDVLITDEAHRLNEKSGLFSNLGVNQIKEIIHASKMSVFFIDEDQRVTLKDIGTVEEIEIWAKEEGSDVRILDLETQFRCNGSDGYISWLDDVLQIRETANFDYVENSDYDIRIFDDPNKLKEEILKKNMANNRSRMVAGYCWNWISEGKNDSRVHDITIPEFDFGMSWNLGNSATWAIDPDSIMEVGCIHTCQGLEFDYIGVIIGDDIRCIDGRIVTDFTKRAKTDKSISGIKALYRKDPVKAVEEMDKIIKNTYRTLMTRGMKGCFIYCTDKGMREYMEKRIDKFNRI